MTDFPPPEPPPPSSGPPQPGWWQASDGNWYPPAEQSAFPAPPSYAPPGYAPAGYGYPMYAPAPTNNGMAIASMVCGIAGFVGFCFLGSLPAVILGHIGVSQIKRTGQQGRGMAIAGLALGYIGLALFIGLILLIAVGSSAETEFQRID